MFVQLYFYCQNLSAEMKDAFIHLSSILGLGELVKGYKLYFISSKHQNKDDDTEDNLESALDEMFKEIQVFENNIKNLW